MPKLDSVDVSITLPFVSLAGTWSPNTVQRDAAWELYVELVTRITVVELAPEQGSLREALSSLYSLFGATREILRRYGPAVAKPKARGELSLGAIAVTILNDGLRPLLAKWHPLLLDHEDTRPPDVSTIEHERRWPAATELRQELAEMRIWLAAYANALGRAAGVAAAQERTARS